MKSSAEIPRPVLRYHGGKWRLAPWIICHFPPHRTYCEPFAGAASVLLRKARSHAEVYNDVDEEIVHVFRVLRDPELRRALREAVEWTPFARAEFVISYQPTEDPIERARRTAIRAYQGFGSAAVNRAHTTGFRAASRQSGTTPARDWINWPKSVEAWGERLMGVVLECRSAELVIGAHDAADTLFYVDPPYVWSTRSFPKGATHPNCYRHEMTDDDHRRLAELLHEVEGMVVLSGYDCPLYQELYGDWDISRADALISALRGGGTRTECLWLNPAAHAGLRQPSIFGGGSI